MTEDELNEIEQRKQEQLRRWAILLRNYPEHSWLFAPGDGWFNITEVSKGTQLSRQTIADLCKRGEIPGALWYGQDIGWRIPRSGITEYLGRLLEQQEQRRTNDAG